MENIAEFMLKIRNEHELTQEGLSKKLDVSENYIHQLETGKKKPGMKFLKELSKKFNYPLLLLLRDTLIPKATTKKERELRKKIEQIIDEFEKAYS